MLQNTLTDDIAPEYTISRPAGTQLINVQAPASGLNTQNIHCVMKTVFNIQRIVSVGDEIPCFYNGSDKHPRLRNITHAHLVHAILWPTVLFVLGIVGIFLSCIMLQYDDEHKANTEQIVMQFETSGSKNPEESMHLIQTHEVNEQPYEGNEQPSTKPSYAHAGDLLSSELMASGVKSATV